MSRRKSICILQAVVPPDIKKDDAVKIFTHEGAGHLRALAANPKKLEVFWKKIRRRSGQSYTHNAWEDIIRYAHLLTEQDPEASFG